MIYRNEDTGRIEFWESVGKSPVADIADGIMDEGVTAVYLSEKIAYHLNENPKIEIAIRHLNVQRNPAMLEELTAVMQQYKEYKYINFRDPADIFETLKAFYDGFAGHNVEDLHTLFCSEFVALIYQQIGLLSKPPAGLPANEYTPADFAAEEALSLLLGSLGSEISIIEI
ncbi:MAG: hypothetical protein GY805_02850 [Chloroflexi bacterium]|nr:hypothetical protein [Chloroflexota bacterium]